MPAKNPKVGDIVCIGTGYDYPGKIIEVIGDSETYGAIPGYKKIRIKWLLRPDSPSIVEESAHVTFLADIISDKERELTMLKHHLKKAEEQANV